MSGVCLLGVAPTHQRYSTRSISPIYYCSWLCSCFSFWTFFLGVANTCSKSDLACVTAFCGHFHNLKKWCLFFSKTYDTTWNLP